MVWIHVQFFKLLMVKERNCYLKNTQGWKKLIEQSDPRRRGYGFTVPSCSRECYFRTIHIHGGELTVVLPTKRPKLRRDDTRASTLWSHYA
jgi:hypothetical protein